MGGRFIAGDRGRYNRVFVLAGLAGGHKLEENEEFEVKIQENPGTSMISKSQEETEVSS